MGSFEVVFKQDMKGMSSDVSREGGSGSREGTMPALVQGTEKHQKAFLQAPWTVLLACGFL